MVQEGKEDNLAEAERFEINKACAQAKFEIGYGCMSKEFNKLVKIAAMLRAKNGCPWDKKQTIDSMLEHFLEEADEVKQAMNKKDYKNLREELGDLIFTMLMITQIAKERKLFNINQVLRDIDKKIRRRHTWVFGKNKVKTAEEALAMWKKNKEKEKAKNSTKRA